MRRFLTLTLAAFLVGCSPDRERGVTKREPGSGEAAPAHTGRAFDGYAQIPDALALAKQTKRNVLLCFGNKGAYYFESLTTIFQKDKAVREELESDYVAVFIDWTKVQDDKVDAGYEVRRPWGAPWIVILDTDGNRLTTLDTSKFEEGDSHNPKMVLGFLQQWKPLRQ